MAVSAFQLDPATEANSPNGGTFGFSVVAESDQPIYQNLNTSEGRAQLGFSPEDEKLMADCPIFSLRVSAGDDASCLNLYRPRQPRILAVPETLRRRNGNLFDPRKGERIWVPSIHLPTRTKGPRLRFP